MPLDTILQAVDSEFPGHTSDDHLSMPVEFQDDAITLEVPEDEVLKNGWEITPLTPPTVSML